MLTRLARWWRRQTMAPPAPTRRPQRLQVYRPSVREQALAELTDIHRGPLFMLKTGQVAVLEQEHEAEC